jgi:diguanylate cyclase (GGDEF)-like protein
VFLASTKSLLEPIQSTRRAAWQLFAGFTISMALLVVIGAVALSRSAKLAHERLHDALTGLPNRALFLERTTQVLQRRRQSDRRSAVIFIDLDGFKPVNDVHGHAVGDALLAAVAARLEGVKRKGDIVGRFGGDEFLILCDGVADAAQAMELAERAQAALANPFDIDGLVLTIGSSIGVAIDDHVASVTADAAVLIHRADEAMYEAKRSGKGRIRCTSGEAAFPTA